GREHTRDQFYPRAGKGELVANQSTDGRHQSSNHRRVFCSNMGAERASPNFAPLLTRTVSSCGTLILTHSTDYERTRDNLGLYQYSDHCEEN
ncbi:hypothetical protein LSTR_LSTR010011, partial [Laodelphax striatellus]